MEWFTREWLTGGLSDEEWQERLDSYDDHLSRLRERLADGPAALLPEATNLHDAQLSSIVHEEDSVRLRLLAGDLQRGYEWVEIVYRGATLTPEHAVSAQLLGGDVEVCADELADAQDAGLEHRLCLWPEGEVVIRFTDCVVTKAPASASERR